MIDLNKVFDISQVRIDEFKMLDPSDSFTLWLTIPKEWLRGQYDDLERVQLVMLKIESDTVLSTRRISTRLCVLNRRYSIFDGDKMLDVKLDVVHLRSIFKLHYETIKWAIDYFYENGDVKANPI